MRDIDEERARSKTYVGKASVMADLLRPLSMRLARGNTIRVHRLLAEGDFVVVQATGHNETKWGMPYENSYCWITRMAGGKMAKLSDYADTELIAAALDDPGERPPRERLKSI
jgi:uncharacterized protein